MTIALPLFLVAYYLLLAATLAAVAYAIWYMVERRERFSKGARGFEVTTNADETSVLLKKRDDDHG